VSFNKVITKKWKSHVEAWVAKRHIHRWLLAKPSLIYSNFYILKSRIPYVIFCQNDGSDDGASIWSLWEKNRWRCWLCSDFVFFFLGFWVLMFEDWQMWLCFFFPRFLGFNVWRLTNVTKVEDDEGKIKSIVVDSL